MDKDFQHNPCKVVDGEYGCSIENFLVNAYNDVFELSLIEFASKVDEMKAYFEPKIIRIKECFEKHHYDNWHEYYKNLEEAKLFNGLLSENQNILANCLDFNEAR